MTSWSRDPLTLREKVADHAESKFVEKTIVRQKLDRIPCLNATVLFTHTGLYQM